MPCCNRRRTRLATSPARPAAPPPAAHLPAGPGGHPDVQLRFTGSQRIRVEGVASGRIYRASPATPLITANQQDVRSLLRSGLFALA